MIETNELICAKKLLNTISASPSPFHASMEAKRQLLKARFKELTWNEDWTLEKGQGYMVSPFDTTIIAFRVNNNFSNKDSVKIMTSHIDSPCLRIKDNPEHFQKDYLKLNTEMYGGAIYSTWMDRPLSVAGRVYLKSSTTTQPEVHFIDMKKPLFVIPNLSIHLNRNVNDGVALNAQVDMLPIGGTSKEPSKTFLRECITKKLNVSSDELLSYELTVYNCENGTIAGINDDFILAPRIDNISSMQACITGITESNSDNGIDIIALFDHEEIGSNTKNGACSNLLPFALERIYTSLGENRENFLKSITTGYLVSLDVAHALNPNHAEKSDITTDLCINEGIAIKSSSRQNYCGDSKMTAILLQLCEKYNISSKVNYLRSDTPGGSTLGPIVSSQLPMLCADVGIPILAMHSAMETAGVKDQYNLEMFAKQFFTLSLE